MASVTNLGRNISQTVSPTIAGFVAQVVFLGAPIIVGSSIKLVYNALLYHQFKSLSPYEETRKGKPRPSELLPNEGEASEG